MVWVGLLGIDLWPGPGQSDFLISLNIIGPEASFVKVNHRAHWNVGTNTLSSTFFFFFSWWFWTWKDIVPQKFWKPTWCYKWESLKRDGAGLRDKNEEVRSWSYYLWLDPVVFLATSTATWLFNCLSQYFPSGLFISIFISFCLGQFELGLQSFEIRRVLL